MTYIPDPPDPKDPQVHHTVGDRSSVARPVTVAPATKATRKPRVRGRVRNVDVMEGLYTFTMRGPKGAEPGGVYVRKRNSREVRCIPFDRIASGAHLSVEVSVAGHWITLALKPDGLEVTREGKTFLLSYSSITNAIASTIAEVEQKQLSLFSNESSGGGK